jgi:murein DD-endopeptidase MepM/ murein hydrolase activator NlpD
MEKTLNENEKIRKAEEIAYRRNYIGEPKTSLENHHKTYLGSKILLELLIIFNIVVCVYCIQNRNEIFKEEFLASINFEKFDIKSKAIEFYNSLISPKNDVFIENSQETDTSNAEENTNDQSSEENSQDTQEVQDNQEQIGGLSEAETQNLESIVQEEKTDSTQIQELYELQKPISGTVTSSFGTRESSNAKISGYHTGTDIAANSGTEIYSAISGTVSLVSNYGDYGNHLKIENGDLVTLYAHCSKILVNEGDTIEKGQVIAKVGSTGNSTGPHLHFEFIYQGRYVNPQEIFEF